METTTKTPAPTTSDVSPDALTERLLPVLHAAREKARAFRRGVIASLTMDLPAAPSRAMLDGMDCFYWEQPSRGLRLAGIGSALDLSADGSDRFERVRAGIGAFFDDDVLEPAGANPLLFAGFAFDDSQTHAPEWAPFPDGLVTLPSLLFATRDGAHSLTLNRLVQPDDDIDAIATEMTRQASRCLEAPASPTRPTATPTLPALEPESHDDWDDSVRALVQRIAQGDAEKVVLARRVTLRLDSPFDADAVLDALRRRYPDCTLFAVRRGDACFLGATPEMLVALSGDEVRADCLAGSAPRGEDEASDRAYADALLADDKERREHALVVRGLREALSPLCSQIDTPATPGLRRTATIQHLHTPLRATTDGRRHVLELVQRLHPTPATAGLPREASLCLIKGQERFSRGWYAGPLGWLDARGDGEFAVALRSGLVTGDEALLFAGCGIVAGSDPRREYDEATNKLAAMRGALAASSNDGAVK